MIDKLNYFSDKEQKVQKDFAKKRTTLLIPVIKILDKTKVTPDFISYLALFLLIPFSFYFKSFPILSSVIIICYVLLDGIDGSLARYQNKDNLGGAFTDIVVDQMGLVVIIGNLIFYEMITPTVAYYYGILYIVMIAFSVVQNALNISMQKLIRTKYIVYLLYILYSVSIIKNFLDSIIPSDFLFDIILILFSLVMLYTNIISYLRLKTYLSKH